VHGNKSAEKMEDFWTQYLQETNNENMAAAETFDTQFINKNYYIWQDIMNISKPSLFLRALNI
jgi:hypothetical protein